jgi:hypothetical protein
MQIHGLDSRRRRYTKKVRHVDLTVAGVTAAPTTILFQPAYNTRWLLVGAYAENVGLTGTITDAPAVLMDNGTDSGSGGTNLVAGVDLSTTDKVVKIFTLAAPGTVLDYLHPLRLKSTDGADGSTAFPVNIILELLQLSN